MKKIIVFSVVLALFAACKKDLQTQKSNFVTFQGNSYALKNARLQRQNDTLMLTLFPATMQVSDALFSGYGTRLDLHFICDSTHLKQGTYVADSTHAKFTIKAKKSLLTTIVQNSTDTARVPIFAGKCDVTLGDAGNRYTMAFSTESGDSIIGNFVGKFVYNNDTDGKKTGEMTIGSKHFDLQRGDLMLWKHALNETLFYYEFYLYSTTLRRSDKGDMKNGLMFVFGLHSDNEAAPTTGTYPFTTQVGNTTALAGYRKGSSDWGCYWYNYANSASEKAFVKEGKIVIEQNENNYKIAIEAKDQHGDAIVGSYVGDFNTINISR